MSFIPWFLVFQVALAGVQPIHSGEGPVPGFNLAVAAEVSKSMDLLERVAHTPTEGVGFEAGVSFFIEQGATSGDVLELAVVSRRNGCEEECLVVALHGAAVLSDTGTRPAAAVERVGASIATVAATFTDQDAAGNAFLLGVELGPLLAASIE